MHIIYELNIYKNMKARSGTHPGTYVDLGKRGYFNYNIQQVTEGEETYYTYEYVEVEEFQREQVIRALIKQQYTLDDEIALINNYNAGTGITEYNNYQTFRDSVKAIADAAFQ